MSTITIDSQVKVLLEPLKEATEIRDADGNILGVYTPTNAMARLYDPVEIARRKQEKGGFTLNEIKEQLKARGI
jgi:hypothetical protein